MTELKVVDSWSAAVFHLLSLYNWITPLPKQFFMDLLILPFCHMYKLHEASY